MTLMATAGEDVQSLRGHIENLEAELANLKTRLARVEGQAAAVDGHSTAGPKGDAIPDNAGSALQKGKLGTAIPQIDSEWPLLQEEYKRYGRQMIVPEIGLKGELKSGCDMPRDMLMWRWAGQLRLRDSSVLVVGLGGLGCPAAAYLAGAGVGTLGLIDGDTVEISNLHRQILHNTRKVGDYKVDSALEFLQKLNPRVKYKVHREHLTAETTPAILAQYDLVLDCTDHPRSRYLISDAAVLLGKPLVSASALRAEGQLMILNSPPKPPGDSTGGPCYRCIFPKPPPVESIISCGDGGILGPVVGVMGILQALEATKLIAAGIQSPTEANGIRIEPPERSEAPSLLLFSAYGSPHFRSVRLRPRRPRCMVCSDNASITLQSLLSGSLDYAQFCGVSQPLNVLHKNERISAEDLQTLRKRPASEYLLIDVREGVQYDICHLDGSVNVPFSDLTAGKALPELSLAEAPWLPQIDTDTPIYIVCRLGNDSQLAVRRLKEAGLDQEGKRYIGDVRGGFKAWKEEVDFSWPEY